MVGIEARRASTRLVRKNPMMRDEPEVTFDLFGDLDAGHVTQGQFEDRNSAPISRRAILPVGSRGRSSTNTTDLGHL